jgi:putative transcriptional regulator
MPPRLSASTAKSSDCLRDHFLLAMPCLNEGIFSHSITYICEHGESGAMGIVINQPLDLSVGEIFDHLQIESLTDFDELPVLAGGPVQIDHGFVLQALGYAGWAAGQLEQELAENSWLTLPADSDIIFSTPTEGRLAAAAALLGIDMNLISVEAGHA